jgi:pimeloyl-ACP methyl ester carboxylesterase
LLEKAGEEPPFLLVAHSYGGHTVRIYAQEHPEDVVGMVLVDTRLPTVDIQTDPMGAGQLRMWGLLARCGFFRLVGKRTLETQAPAILEKIPDYPFPIVWGPKYFETSRLETLVTAESDQQARATGPFGDLPLVVIAHEIPDLFSHLPPDEMQAVEAEYQAGQMNLTELSTNSQFLIAEGSGHTIPVENPGVIIAAVRAVLDGSQ